MSNETLLILKKTGAFLKGHFKLSSGLHSSGYIQCALALQHPEFAEKIGKSLAELFRDEKVDVVIAPAIGGIVLCQEVAKALRVRAIFTERVPSGEMLLRRGFEIGADERVLVVEDVITTGRSTGEVIELVRKSGGIVAGCGCIVNRVSGEAAADRDTKALVTLGMEIYDPGNCSLCEKGIPVMKPGSRNK